MDMMGVTRTIDHAGLSFMIARSTAFFYWLLGIENRTVFLSSRSIKFSVR